MERIDRFGDPHPKQKQGEEEKKTLKKQHGRTVGTMQGRGRGAL